MATANTLIGFSEDLSKFDRTNIGIPALEETALLRVLHNANSEYVETFKKGGGEPPIFMRSETGGTLVGDTDLDESGGTLTTDTTLDLTSATNASSSGGAIVIWDNDMPDITEYTGKSTNQLTGVTGMGFAHEDTDGVAFLYALPSTFLDLRAVPEYGDGVQVNGRNYTYTSGTPRGTQFSIYDNGTTQYLWFARGTSGDYSVYFNKRTTTIDDTADSVDIPDYLPNDQWFLVYRLCEYASSVLGLNIDRVNDFKIRADRILASALKTRQTGKRVRTVRSARDITRMANSSGHEEYYNSRAGSYGWNV